MSVRESEPLTEMCCLEEIILFLDGFDDEYTQMHTCIFAFAHLFFLIHVLETKYSHSEAHTQA